jgi:hypothetical protein
MAKPAVNTSLVLDGIIDISSNLNIGFNIKKIYKKLRGAGLNSALKGDAQSYGA